ncbi:E2f5 [Acrasis kona]|uniref:E2f5 n=1 Tax=Acrasis kona TaxID=1008807 RepID=A0AAW2ZEY7_9EUKA
MEDLPQLGGSNPRTNGVQSSMAAFKRNSTQMKSITAKVDKVLDQLTEKEQVLKREMEQLEFKRQKQEKKRLWINEHLRDTPGFFRTASNKYVVHTCSCDNNSASQNERFGGLHYIIDKLEEEIKRQKDKCSELKKGLREEQTKNSLLTKQLQDKNDSLVKELTQEQLKNVDLRRKVRELKKKNPYIIT